MGVTITASGGTFAFTFTLRQAIIGGKIEIYDGALSTASAILKRTLTLSALSAGRQTVTWDGRDSINLSVAAGTCYFVLKLVGVDTNSYYAFDSCVV